MPHDVPKLAGRDQVRGRCKKCRKECWPTRKAARQYSRTYPDRLSPYPCPHVTGCWHLGHLPPAVKAGTTDRRTLYRR